MEPKPADRKDLKERQQEFIRLVEANRLEDARRCCDDTLAEWPRAWQPRVNLASIAVREEKLDTARSWAAGAARHGAPPLPLARLEWAIAAREGTGSERQQALDRLVAMDPDNERWRSESFKLRVARAIELSGAGDRDAAWNEMEEACRCATGEPFPDVLQLAIEDWIADDPAQLRYLERLVREHPRCAAPMWSLAIVLDFHGETERARALLRENWSWARRLRPPARMGMWEHVDLESDREGDDSHAGVRHQAMLLSGGLEDAQRAAGDLMRPLLLQAAGLSASGLDSMAPPRGAGELVESGSDRSQGTVLVFTGLRDQTWAPLHVLDVFLAALGLRALYLRDFRRLAFLDGLESLGGSLEATVSALRERVDGKGPVYTMGNSAGGLAALVYAERLGARRTLVFSPPTTMDPVLVDRMGDGRARLWHRRFLSLVDHRPFDAAEIAARMPSSFRMTVYAGARNTEDRAHAQRMVGLPGVELNLLDGVEQHNSLAYAAAGRGLLEVFRNAYLS